MRPTPKIERTNLYPDFVPDAVQAFTESNRMVIPIAGAPYRLQSLVTRELTHVFENDMIPQGVFSPRHAPLGG